MKRKKFFVLGVSALVLTFGLILAGCGKRESPASDFTYELSKDKKGIVIKGYTGPGGAVVIPSTIEDMPVVDFSNDRIFGGQKELTSVTIPDNFKSIPMQCFRGCSKLQKVNLPVSLERIGMQAFEGCVELTEVIIPASLTVVEFDGNYGFVRNNAAFRDCGKLPLKTRQAIEALDHTTNDTGEQLW
ncbi:leucine-rich repeat domain-containing protein [Breznakiellaceae bacterium SP9]